mmetsp:Transcript_8022/g.18660  ORF Transcript_8022/g.18660 Transcript_8022/m.18660 type:complete len:234 (+) Transcript_8022:194-895(+)
MPINPLLPTPPCTRHMSSFAASRHEAPAASLPDSAARIGVIPVGAGRAKTASMKLPVSKMTCIGWGGVPTDSRTLYVTLLWLCSATLSTPPLPCSPVIVSDMGRTLRFALSLERGENCANARSSGCVSVSTPSWYDGERSASPIFLLLTSVRSCMTIHLRNQGSPRMSAFDAGSTHSLKATSYVLPPIVKTRGKDSPSSCLSYSVWNGDFANEPLTVLLGSSTQVVPESNSPT